MKRLNENLLREAAGRDKVFVLIEGVLTNYSISITVGIVRQKAPKSSDIVWH
jgi:hypothetical protein